MSNIRGESRNKYSDEQVAWIEDKGRQIALELERRRFATARHVLDATVTELTAAEVSDLEQTPLAMTGIEVRALNMLEREFAVTTVAELLAVEPSLLLTAAHVGDCTVFKLLKQLVEYAVGQQRLLLQEIQRLKGD